MRHLIDIVEQQELNEGIANKIATAALLGATALGTPTTSMAHEPAKTTQTIGGWYPVIFQQWDDSKIQDIIDRAPQTRRILITYDDNRPLAKEIYRALRSAGITVEVDHTPMTDTSDTQYDHNSVTATVYRK